MAYGAVFYDGFEEKCPECQGGAPYYVHDECPKCRWKGAFPTEQGEALLSFVDRHLAIDLMFHRLEHLAYRIERIEKWLSLPWWKRLFRRFS